MELKKGAIMIPKKIHYCWFGGKPLPEKVKKFIDTWKKNCPDYEIICWDETNYNLDETCAYVHEAYEEKKWAFVSDYVRLKVLYENGIYTALDMERIRSKMEPILNRLFHA